jgi:hypothetical protein
MARAAIHGSRARFSTSRSSVRSRFCGAQGVEQEGLDIPCKGCAHRFSRYVETNRRSGAFIIGIWLSPNPKSLPILTLFGSTNLNSRSAHLDTELSFVMLANSVTVQKKLQLELQGLQNFAEDWKGDRRNVRPLTKLLVRLLSGYL